MPIETRVPARDGYSITSNQVATWSVQTMWNGTPPRLFQRYKNGGRSTSCHSPSRCRTVGVVFLGSAVTETKRRLVDWVLATSYRKKALRTRQVPATTRVFRQREEQVSRSGSILPVITRSWWNSGVKCLYWFQLRNSMCRRWRKIFRAYARLFAATNTNPERTSFVQIRQGVTRLPVCNSTSNA